MAPSEAELWSGAWWCAEAEHLSALDVYLRHTTGARLFRAVLHPVGEDTALRWLSSAAAALESRVAAEGHAEAQFHLGLIYSGTNKVGHDYHQGRGVTRDVDRAIALYAQAGEQGHARALLNLGVAF